MNTTITLNVSMPVVVTLEHLAVAFANLPSDDQIRFFEHVADEVQAWPVMGWDIQATAIAEAMTEKAARVLLPLADAMVAESDK